MISEVVMKINQKEKDMRREKILDVAFRLFVDQKIESLKKLELVEQHYFAIFQESWN